VGACFYNNLLALLLFPVFFYITGEFLEASSLTSAEWTLGQVFPIALSCAFGLAISFSPWRAARPFRPPLSVLGVTNKFLTVTMNVAIWDKHASPFGIFCLCLTMHWGGSLPAVHCRPPPCPGPSSSRPRKVKASGVD